MIFKKKNNSVLGPIRVQTPEITPTVFISHLSTNRLVWGGVEGGWLPAYLNPPLPRPPNHHPPSSSCAYLHPPPSSLPAGALIRERVRGREDNGSSIVMVSAWL